MDRKLVGEHIRLARERIGFTQKELAKQIGKAHVTISSYETATRSINVDDLILLADALKVDICFFFHGDQISLSETDESLISRVNSLSGPIRDYIYEMTDAALDLDKDIVFIYDEIHENADIMETSKLRNVRKAMAETWTEDMLAELDVALSRRFRELRENPAESD